MINVLCVETTKNSWLKIGMILSVIKEDGFGRYYFSNAGVAHKRLFKEIKWMTLNIGDIAYFEAKYSLRHGEVVEVFDNEVKIIDENNGIHYISKKYLIWSEKKDE